jgi:putative Ca2+/H+ antiporter (TMEM165/GDT1 family)
MCTEWGDPSQISAVGLTAKYGVVSVLMGGGLALTTSVSLAILMGSMVANLFSQRCLNLVSGLIFVIFGVRELVAVLNS